MTIFGFIVSIIALMLGIVLVVTANDDVFANLVGVISIILGTVWGFVYFAMLMGW